MVNISLFWERIPLAPLADLVARDLDVAGEAETGVQAMGLAGQLMPDVILLDIQMPGCSGIGVAACLAEPRPRVIFCTACDQHAVDAFELNAVACLLKPISRVRLTQPPDRARSLAGDSRESALPRTARAQRTGPARFLVRNASHYTVVGESRVLYFASEGGLNRLVGDGAQYWMDPTLNELEQLLDAARFFRISRAARINLNAVAEVFPLPGRPGEVLLKNGQRLEVSRRRYQDLLEALGGVTS